MANPLLAAAGQVAGRRAGSFATSYAGAKTGSLYADWILAPVSADLAARLDLQTLRMRARELVMNDAVGARIPQLFSENIVGEHGFTLQANLGNSRGGRNVEMSLRVERAFYDWADNWCTVDGRQSYAEVQAMAVENEPTDGEFLVHLVRGFDNPYGFALELIDPDQLDHTLNRPSVGGSPEIRMGVEVDRWRRPLRYHLLKEHPSERASRGQYQELAADALIHLYLARRPQQTRGVTWFAPVILNLHMLAGGREAVLVAMRAAAANAVMFEVDPDKGYAPPPDQGEDERAMIPTDLAPGAGYELPPGVTAKFNNPPFADGAYDPFERGMLRTSAGAVGVSYASLSGDLTQASYGSQRVGLLSERAGYRKLQRRFDRRFLTPIYRAWLREALLSGALRGDSLDPQRYWEVQWHPRPFPWIDPLKDAEAEDTKVGMGVQTRTRIANEGGDDFRTLVDEQAEEIAYARERGVPLFVNGVDVTGLVAAPATTPRETREAADARDDRERRDAAASASASPPLRVVNGDE